MSCQGWYSGTTYSQDVLCPCGPGHHDLVGPVIIRGLRGKKSREDSVWDKRNWLCCPLRAPVWAGEGTVVPWGAWMALEVGFCQKVRVCVS